MRRAAAVLVAVTPWVSLSQAYNTGHPSIPTPQAVKAHIADAMQGSGSVMFSYHGPAAGVQGFLSSDQHSAVVGVGTGASAVVFTYVRNYDAPRDISISLRKHDTSVGTRQVNIDNDTAFGTVSVHSSSFATAESSARVVGTGIAASGVIAQATHTTTAKVSWSDAVTLSQGNSNGISHVSSYSHTVGGGLTSVYGNAGSNGVWTAVMNLK
jgi:hypothetical protein